MWFYSELKNKILSPKDIFDLCAFSELISFFPLCLRMTIRTTFSYLNNLELEREKEIVSQN